LRKRFAFVAGNDGENCSSGDEKPAGPQ
jgi:hypothetical protein